MDANIKNVIDARKSALDIYTDNYIIDKKEELFKRIYELGESCSDITDFENKFSNSFNDEYINLITEAGTLMASEVNTYNPSLKDIAKQEIKSKARGKIMDTPVGDVIQTKQTIDIFKKFFKK